MGNEIVYRKSNEYSNLDKLVDKLETSGKSELVFDIFKITGEKTGALLTVAKNGDGYSFCYIQSGNVKFAFPLFIQKNKLLSYVNCIPRLDITTIRCFSYAFYDQENKPFTERAPDLDPSNVIYLESYTEEKLYINIGESFNLNITKV